MKKAKKNTKAKTHTMEQRERQATSTLTLTGVIVQDTTTQGYTAYLLELPEVIAEGNTEEQAEKALFENLRSVLEFRREDSENEMKGKHYSTKSFELSLK